MTNNLSLSSLDPDLLAEGIAIVGMAARFPGASNVDEFWDNLRNGVESLTRLSDETLLEGGVTPDVLKDPSYIPVSGSLRDVEMFDAGYFGFSPKDAAITDPQHRHFLECAVEAFEEAGHSTRRFEGAIGVFAGCGMNSYFINNLLTNSEMTRTVGAFLLRHTGNDRDFLPTTVSYKLDLRGPSMAIQTACSTSLVAIHAACQSLLTGESDMALAGGSTILVPNGHGYYHRENEPVSPDGHCRPFDADSAGTVLSSGTGAIVLRRLEDAIADGDSIHAVIRGSAVNNDGAGKIGYLAPSVEGHASVVAEALAVANVPAESISYIETHGTGTRVGDPIEIAALTQAFRASTEQKQFCRIGSVKSNIGHMDTAAGVASLIKVVKSLEARELAPTLHFKSPNPEIDFESTPFVVNAENHQWSTDGGPRRAGVSSLGIGGTNAHLIVEEAPDLPRSDSSLRERQALVVSARSRKALSSARARLAGWLKDNGDKPLADVAFTLQEGRDYWDHRLVVTATNIEDAVRELENEQSTRTYTTKNEGESRGVAFMFSGAGGQYPNMSRGLYEQEPVFRDSMDKCIALLDELLEFSIKPLVYPEPGQESEAEIELRRPSRLCPAVVAVEWSLVQLWKSWGIEPVGMIGHSLGEYVAACVSGVLSVADMLRVVVLRGNLIEELRGGAMISLPLSESEAIEFIGNDLDLAAINSPGLCVASGSVESVESLSKRLQEHDIEARMIPVDAAGHSRHLDPILAAFADGLSEVSFSSPKIPYVSNVTGTWVSESDVTDPKYWLRHLRHTVRFSEGLQELIDSNHSVLLEVGPGQSLCAFARQQQSKPRGIVPSLRKAAEEIPDQEYALSAFAKLWASGYDVQWEKLRDSEERRRRLRLPSYPFEHSAYWVEPGIAAASVESQKYLSKLDSLDDWTRSLTWHPASLPSNDGRGWDGTWLVFLDAAGIGEALVDRLRSGGCHVVSVRIADAFCRLGDNEFALAPELGLEGYQELIATLGEDGLYPDRIVHLWNVTPEETYRPGSSFLDRNQECGFYSLLFLMQALGEAADTIADITIVTNGMTAVNREEIVLYPEKATVLGPMRVIPREFPKALCRCIDVSFQAIRSGGLRAWVGLESARVGDDEIRMLADRLHEEVGSACEANMIALRGSERFEEVMAASRLQPAVEGIGFRKGGVYLITGGLGGLGFALAARIGLDHQAKLVLLGRSPFPDETQWDDWLNTHADEDATASRIRTIREIRANGGDVMIASGDVTDLQAAQRIVSVAEEKLGTIQGIFHAAASVSDGLMQTKTKEGAEVTFSAKLYGTRVLDEAFRGHALDFFVLFSSTSAVVGLPGQIDYAAANAYLNAFAERRTRLGKRTIAIDWGIWHDVGSATSLARQIRNEPEAPKLVRPAQHPLLGNCVESSDEVLQWQATWNAQDLWVLNEHRTGAGVALLPGTAYLEIARAAFEESTGEQFCRIEDVAFLQPLVVRDNHDASVAIRLTRQGREYRLSVRDTEADIEHATMTVGFGSPARENIHTETIIDNCQHNRQITQNTDQALASSQEAQLSFGQRWSVLREIGYGHNEAYAILRLDSESQSDVDDYVLHPAMLDIATSIGIPLVRDWKSDVATYVPLAYGSIQVYGPLKSEIFARVVSHPENELGREVVTFDITVSDRRGVVLLQIGRYQMRKLLKGSEFAAAEGSGAANRRRPEPTAMESIFLEAYDNGIDLNEGVRILGQALAGNTEGALIVCPLAIDDWNARIRSACDATSASAGITFERPELETEFEPPRNSLDEKLISIWQELLGVDQIGIQDDFFELGGHSLIAVRMFAKMKNQWSVDWPISMLFDAPNVAGLSDLLSAEVGSQEQDDTTSNGPAESEVRHRHLVAMNRPAQKGIRRPLFIVAGMFGNVLNLRHLAAHLGEDQPVYALQAKGLYGEEEPHQTFEHAAEDYIAEIRQIQPSGPYIVGGFSGGGVTAFEITHQLLAIGEEVDAIVMLDSIPPHPAWPEPNYLERLQIKMQRIGKVVFRNPLGWLKTRIKWELEKRSVPEAESAEKTPAEFRSDMIEQAFRSALSRYKMRKLPLSISLFRPQLDRTYVLWSGRSANSDGQLMEHENWWSPWVRDLEVTIVPGDHDSMVLEPNVKQLARHVRRKLDECHQAETSQCKGLPADNGKASEVLTREQGVRCAN